MFRSTARSSTCLSVERAYPGPSRRVIHSRGSPCLLQSDVPTTISNRLQSQKKCTVTTLHSRFFSTTPIPHSTYRSRRVHREAITALNRTFTGRVPSFTGSPPAANPAALRRAAKAQRTRSVLGSTRIGISSNPPAFLDYEPQKNKKSSVFFWSDEVNELDKKLMAKKNYPPPLPRFKHDENQKIAKCHPSVWIASAHHLQMMHEGYDRIAFLGDSVAGKCLSDLLLNDYYCIAGVMTGLKGQLVSNAQFAYFSRVYNIPCKSNESAQGDAFEALVGALYLDGKRDGVDIDRIIYNWLKSLWEPWIDLYINQLPQTQRDRVVSLHHAVPIGIAVATSDSPDSHQVMMAWESNIATYMIENRGKSRPKMEQAILSSTFTKEAAALRAPTVDAVGTSTAAPLGFFKGTSKEEIKQLLQWKQRELEEGEGEEQATKAGELNETTLQDSAAASRAVWPTIKVTPESPVSEGHKDAEKSEAEAVQREEIEHRRMEGQSPEAGTSQKTEAWFRCEQNDTLDAGAQWGVEAGIRRRQNEALKAEAATRAEAERYRIESETLRKANEERRQREEERRKTEAKRQQEEDAVRMEEARMIRKAKILQEEKNLQNELACAEEVAEEARKKAVEERRRLLEKERPKTKAEKRAERRAAKLQEQIKLIAMEREKIELAEVEKEMREKAEKERAEGEKVEREKVEKEKAEREKAEREKAEKEKAEKEKAEKEKSEKEKAEEERAEKERAKAEEEKAEKARVDKEKEATERARREKVRKERAEKERVERDRVEKERLQRDKEWAERERVERKLAKEQAEKERAKHSVLIAEKEAVHVKALADEEARLKWKRLLYDVDRMEERMVKQRELMIASQPQMTEIQKEQFKMSWQQYIEQQRGILERQAGMEVGSSRLKAIELAEAKEKTERGETGENKAEQEKIETAEEKPREQPESKSLWRRLWGTVSGKN